MSDSNMGNSLLILANKVNQSIHAPIVELVPEISELDDIFIDNDLENPIEFLNIDAAPDTDDSSIDNIEDIEDKEDKEDKEQININTNINTNINIIMPEPIEISITEKKGVKFSDDIAVNKIGKNPSERLNTQLKKKIMLRIVN